MNKLIWSSDLTDIITQYYPNYGATVVARMIHRKYGINPPCWKVIAKAKRMGIRYTGPRKAWKKGNRPHNAGQRMPPGTYEKVRRTMFKPGNKPALPYPMALSQSERHTAAYDCIFVLPASGTYWPIMCGHNRTAQYQPAMSSGTSTAIHATAIYPT